MEEPMEFIIQASNAAKGFKIATTISASIPLLLLIPFIFDEPTHSSGDDLLRFFISNQFCPYFDKKAIWILPH